MEDISRIGGKDMCRVAIIEQVDKNSEFWAMFADFWLFNKICINAEPTYVRDEAYWEKVQTKTSEFTSKHPSRYAAGLATVFNTELGIRARLESEQSQKENRKMAIVESIDKTSEMWSTFTDFWQFNKKFINAEGSLMRDDEYWKAVQTEASDFTRKHPTRYAKNLAIAFMEEINIRSKLENEAEEMERKKRNRENGGNKS